MKFNLIKQKRFDLLCKFKVHKIKHRVESEYVRERDSKVPTSPQFAQQWLTVFNSINL
jgi:hypothetical protein